MKDVHETNQGLQQTGHSRLSIVAFVLSLLCFLSPIGIVLAIIDLILSRKDNKKHVFSIAGLVVGVIMCVISFWYTFGNDSLKTALADIPDTEVSTEVTNNVFTETAPVNITRDMYLGIQMGMSYDDVKSVMGTDGRMMIVNKSPESSQEVYQWSADDADVNTVTVTLVNGQVTSKAQYGIDTGDDVTVTSAQYDAIMNDMSYDDVVATFGGQGALTSESTVDGFSCQVYAWFGTEYGTNVTISFTDGKVVAKSQIGLE